MTGREAVKNDTKTTSVLFARAATIRPAAAEKASYGDDGQHSYDIEPTTRDHDDHHPGNNSTPLLLLSPSNQYDGVALVLGGGRRELKNEDC